MRCRPFVLAGFLLGLGSCAPIPSRPPLAGTEPIFAPGFEAGANLHSNAGLDLLRAMGGRWVRLNLDWEGIQPREGVWDFRGADAAVEAAERAGLKIYACLLYSPPWASGNGRSNGVPRRDAWEAYVRKVASRYGGRIQAYGIWNEPNLEEFWTGNARDYVQMLLLPASQIIHAEAPGVLVAGPDLAQLATATVPVGQFFRELRLYGGVEALDVISHHVYGREDFSERLLGARFLGVSYRPGLKQCLEQASLTGKPLWLTETGVDARDIGEERQAQLLEEQWRLLAAQPWVKKAFIYVWADDANGDPRWGLLNIQGRPKPAYEKLKRLLRGDPDLPIR